MNDCHTLTTDPAPTPRDKGLALQVAIRVDRPADTCAAWMDAADRICGKAAVAPWLCKRHKAVAEKRAAKQAGHTVQRADADKADWYAEQIAATKERIARDEAAIRRFEQMPRPDSSDALAAINAPLKQRQRGMSGEMKVWRAAREAESDLPAARARLNWLIERAPA